MPKIFFERLAEGAIPVYETPEKYAICREYEWHVCNMDLPFPHMIRTIRCCVEIVDFDPLAPDKPKFQPWLKRKIKELPLDGIFILPFRPMAYGKLWGQWMIAGLMFIPASENPSYEPHFEGSAKEAASYAYKVVHSPITSKNPVVQAAVESAK